MSSLPDQFEDSDTTKPFTAHTNQRMSVKQNSKSKKTFFLFFLLCVLLAVVAIMVVFGVKVDKPMDKVAFVLGQKPTTKSVADTQQESLTELHALISQQSLQQASITDSIKVLNGKLTDINNELIESQSREAQLEQHYQELKADIELLKKPIPTPKSITAIKPKEPVKPVVLVSLLSIRIQGGITWISLSEGLDISPLLTVGDEWHGYKMVSADPFKKEAQLSVKGAITVVRL